MRDWPTAIEDLRSWIDAYSRSTTHRGTAELHVPRHLVDEAEAAGIDIRTEVLPVAHQFGFSDVKVKPVVPPMPTDAELRAAQQLRDLGLA